MSDKCPQCGTTPPSLPEGAREALEKAAAFIAEEYITQDYEDHGEWLPPKARAVHAKLIAALHDPALTPIPSSAGLIDGGGELQQDADRWRAFLNGIPRNSDSKRLLIEFADSLRARAADRSAT